MTLSTDRDSTVRVHLEKLPAGPAVIQRPRSPAVDDDKMAKKERPSSPASKSAKPKAEKDSLDDLNTLPPRF